MDTENLDNLEETSSFKITPVRSNNVVDFTFSKPEYSSERWSYIEKVNNLNQQNYILDNYFDNEIPEMDARIMEFNRGGNTMATNEFATQKELDHLEEKIDLKFENMHTKIGGEFQVINIKIDNLPDLFENMLLKNEKEQEEKRKQTNQYIWGTIIIGGLGLIISIASLFF